MQLSFYLVIALLLLSLAIVLSRRQIQRLFSQRPLDVPLDEDVYLETDATLWERLISDLTRRVTHRFDTFVASQDVNRMQLFLLQAGTEMSVRQYYARCFTFAALITVSYVVYHIVTGGPFGVSSSGQMLFALVGIVVAFAGYRLPYFLLSRRRKSRLKKALAEAPMWMSSLSVLVSSGKTPQDAISILSNHPGIIYSLGRQVQKDIQVGRPFTEALMKMAERVGVPEVTDVAKGIARSAQRGLPLHTNLQVRAEMLHNIVQGRIEERIGRNILTVFIVMVIFALPVFCSVLMAPIAYDFITRFGTVANPSSSAPTTNQAMSSLTLVRLSDQEPGKYDLQINAHEIDLSS